MLLCVLWLLSALGILSNLIVILWVSLLLLWLLEIGEKNWFFPHSEKVNTNVPLQVDIEAIILALNIATKLNASHFVKESDSEICIDSIRDPGDQVPWRLLSFVSAVNSIFIELGSISFSRVYHEENLAAHELAKWSRSHFYFWSYDLGHCPPSVVDVIVKEAGLFE